MGDFFFTLRLGARREYHCLIPPNTRTSSHCSKVRKKMKKIYCLFTDDMIVYLDNTKEPILEKKLNRASN
jgi:hypothetical protein